MLLTHTAITVAQHTTQTGDGKPVGHHARLGENLSLIWLTYPQRKPSWFGLCARLCAR